MSTDKDLDGRKGFVYCWSLFRKDILGAKKMVVLFSVSFSRLIRVHFPYTYCELTAAINMTMFVIEIDPSWPTSVETVCIPLKHS